MAGTLESQRAVRGLEHGLGDFRRREAAVGEDPDRRVPVFDQILDPRRFSVAFAPGGATFQVLANDQNRFTLPRSLPPILDLQVPEDPDNPTGAYVITRHAYTESAFHLLEDLLAQGHVFEMNGFLELARSLTQVLAWLHEHGIVHGQWNARSVIAVATEELACPLLETSNHRFEVIGTGVCFADAAAVPREWLERGYYPPEAFLAGNTLPDYGALDPKGDVYCCAAFLKDLMQRACSSEELPSQARRILDALHKEANRRGWKSSPERVQRKEMEVLDHLYTIRVRSESLIQEAMRPRDERSSAATLHGQVAYLHGKARSYLEELFARGFEPVNVFDGQLQHYTTFQLEVWPPRVNNHEDSRVLLRGVGLPHEVVRVSLNESHQGLRVLSARPECIEFEVGRGFRDGTYRISVNNRRTNATLEVFAPVWEELVPAEVHQPWEGFGNIRLEVRGRDLPVEVDYALRPCGGGNGHPQTAPDDTVAVVGRSTEDEHGQVLQLTFPCDTAPGDYELWANGMPTGLRARVREQLPEPALAEDGLQPGRIKNHEPCTLRLRGKSFHPAMTVDFGEGIGADVVLTVTGPTEAELAVPAGFPPGDHRLRLNHRETPVCLTVIEPRWHGMEPAAIKLLRDQREPVPVLLTGESLPEPAAAGGYALALEDGTAVADAIAGHEEAEPGRVHRLELAPDLPRGRCAIRFGGLDTGLRLHVQRQWPRAAWAAVLVVGLGLVAAAGTALYRAFEPRILGVEPAAVFAFGTPQVTLSGAHLAAVELLDAEGGVAGRFALEETDSGSYRFTPRGLAPGSYGLRPVGPLYGAVPSGHSVVLRSPGLRLEPIEVLRVEDAELRLVADHGFDVGTVGSVHLHCGANGTTRELSLFGGSARLQRGTFARGEEGDYAVTIADLHQGVAEREPLRLRVLGPTVAAVEPNPVTRSPEGTVHVDIAGANLGVPLLLVPADGVAEAPEGEEPAALPLELDGQGGFRAEAPPGRYRIALAPAGLPREPVDDLLLTVLPQPAVARVSPDRLEPDRPAEIAVAGNNLAALERIELRPAAPAAPDARPMEVPLVRRDDGWFFEASLPSGTWQVGPAEGTVTLEVYDDCRATLQEFAATGEVEGLMQCLRDGRPPAEVRRAAADLLFDRGRFATAAALYADDGDLVARFRRNFVDALVNQQPVPLIVLTSEERSSPYAVAAGRLGWTGTAMVEFDAGPLPWELAYAKGRTAGTPAEAVAALSASIAAKSEASGGFEHAVFEPAHRDLSSARLDLALATLARSEVTRAAELLAGLVGTDGEDWAWLTGERRATALFWHGHVQLWYQGDEAAAVATFRRGADLLGRAAGWARAYLGALQVDAGRAGAAAGEPAPEEAPAAAGTGWEPTFVQLFRLHREATRTPNYNLLAAAEPGSGLSAGERRKNGELKQVLLELDGLEPRDPFAHHALLHSVRTAQQVSWPAQADGDAAKEHRARLLGLAVPAELEPVRRYYVVHGDLAPYDYPQVVSLSRAERSAMAEQAQKLAELPLPAAFHEAAEQLKGRFLGPSVRWWRETRQ